MILYFFPFVTTLECFFSLKLNISAPVDWIFLIFGQKLRRDRNYDGTETMNGWSIIFQTTSITSQTANHKLFSAINNQKNSISGSFKRKELFFETCLQRSLKIQSFFALIDKKNNAMEHYVQKFSVEKLYWQVLSKKNQKKKNICLCFINQFQILTVSFLVNFDWVVLLVMHTVDVKAVSHAPICFENHEWKFFFAISIALSPMKLSFF